MGEYLPVKVGLIMTSASKAAFMQPPAASTHDTEVRMRDADRLSLSAQVEQFLKGNKITQVSTRCYERKVRPTFNNAIALAPTRRTAAAAEKEKLHAAIRELSYIEIAGVKLRRSATEVAKLLQQKGFKLRAQSVMRAAGGIGIELNK